jgi:cytochrome c biogenesis protein
VNSLLTLSVYQGDLGLDTGAPVNVYSLDTDSLEQLAGRDSEIPALELRQGESVDLPNGLGSIEFTGLERFVSIDVHHDPTEGWVLFFALAALGGLLVSLFIPRRRVWMKAVTGPDGVRLEYAGLARGEDPGLTAAIDAFAQRHRAELGDPEPDSALEPERRMST